MYCRGQYDRNGIVKVGGTLRQAGADSAVLMQRITEPCTRFVSQGPKIPENQAGERKFPRREIRISSRWLMSE